MTSDIRGRSTVRIAMVSMVPKAVGTLQSLFKYLADYYVLGDEVSRN